MSLAGTRVVVRGAGDLATGVISRLVQAGCRVGATELAAPLTVRRTVSLSTAIYDGTATVENLIARRVSDRQGWDDALAERVVPITVADQIPSWLDDTEVIVDARLAKRNIDTARNDAPLVVALGPGFSAGDDCDVVIETNRGHRLGRVIRTGSAEPNTGTPGIVSGRGAERVLRAPRDGAPTWVVDIGDVVAEGEVLGSIGGDAIVAPFDGVVRGLMHPACRATAGLKVGDIDPRVDFEGCHDISDKALSIGGGVLEAVAHFTATTNCRA